MDPLIVIEQVAILGILMGVGYIGGIVGILNDEENKSMTTILTNIALPALVISAFSLGYSKETLNGIILIFILSLLGHIIAGIIGKIAFIKYSGSKGLILRFGNMFANSGFMGIPFVYALFGEKALLYASVYMIGFHILIWTYGEALLEKGRSGSIIKKLIKNPSVISIFIGMAIFVLNIKLPNVIAQPVSILSALTSPLAMIILGERISKLNIREIFTDKDIYYGCFVKLIVTPLITLFILSFVNIDPLVKNIVVLMQSLPLAVLTVVLSQKHEANADFASKLTVVSHVLSVITIPLISMFL